MGQILHGSAKTTEAVRFAIQNSKESLRSLAKKYLLTPNTVAKWKKRTTTQDAPMGPKNPRSTVLTMEEEAICIAFRRHTLLSLDDCLYALQATIPKLSRSSLHRLFQRHNMSRLPNPEEDKGVKNKKKFKAYPLGYFHIDISQVQTEEGKHYLFVAIDRTSKFVYVELLSRSTKMETAHFLENLIKSLPYTIHTILTDNGIQFTNRSVDKHSAMHIFDRICSTHNIEHRLTKVNHPWTNGQVERMNRTIKEATVKHYHYENHQELEKHLYAFVNAYNGANRLKTLNGLTPYAFIMKIWENKPEYFRTNPTYLNLGPYRSIVSIVSTTSLISTP